MKKKKMQGKHKHEWNCVNNTVRLFQQHFKYPYLCCFHMAKQEGNLSAQFVLQLQRSLPAHTDDRFRHALKRRWARMAEGGKARSGEE